MTTHFWQVPEIGVNAIQIDIDAETIGRNYPVEVGIHGDARTVVERMLVAAARVEREAWRAQVDHLASDWKSEWERLMKSDAAPIRPERVCGDLTDLVPDDGIVVVDTGHAGMWMGGFYDTRTADQTYLRSAGHLGWAYPAALGAKCGAPERPVVCFTGDSGFWYHLGEIETAVRWDLATVTIVNNNSSGNQSKRGFDRAYGGVQTDQGARDLWHFTDVDFAAIANEIGAVGLRVERPAELRPAIEQALASGRPAIVDVVTDIDALAPLAVIG